MGGSRLASCVPCTRFSVQHLIKYRCSAPGTAHQVQQYEGSQHITAVRFMHLALLRYGSASCFGKTVLDVDGGTRSLAGTSLANPSYYPVIFTALSVH